MLPIAFVAFVTSCAEDDPIIEAAPLTTTIELEPTTTTSTTTTSTTTTTTSTTTTVPPTTTVRDPLPIDNQSGPIVDAIQSLWPEDEWDRALSVAFCESGLRLDAANPTSSARGVFQLLAPWTRDPGSGRTVWGWHYSADGEKLSAAAALGIASEDARYGMGNIVVAHEIWTREGWSPWAASQLCWAE